MTKLLSAVAVSLLAISAFAQEETTSSDMQQKTRGGSMMQERPEINLDTLAKYKDKIMQEVSQWKDFVDGEKNGLPEEIRGKSQMSRQRADSLGRMVHALKIDTSLTKEEIQQKVKELIAAHKEAAEARVKEHMEKMEEFKTAHRGEIETAKTEVKARIETKKGDLETKRAEIEQKIAEKKAEKAAEGTTAE